MNDREREVLLKQPEDTKKVRYESLKAPILKPIHKKYLAWLYFSDLISTRELSRRFNINRQTAFNMKQKYISGSEWYNNAGRPKKFDTDDIDYLIQLAEDGHQLSECIKYTTMLEKMNKRLEEKGKTPACEKTLKGVLKSHGFKLRQSQNKNKNRMLAESDPRNVINAAVAMEALLKDMSPHQLWNMDATQLKIQHDKKGSLCVLPPGYDINIPTTSEGSGGGLDTYYKFTALVNGQGYMADTYLVFSDNKYTANDDEHFEHYKIPGVGVHGNPLYLGILKKRGGNDASWAWFLSEYLIEQFKIYREKMEIPPDQKFVLTMDGEDAQIKPFLDEVNDAIKKKFEDNNILVLKLPASCSAILQTLDKCKLFLSSKKALSRSIEQIRETTSTFYQMQLEKVKEVLTNRDMKPEGYKVTKGKTLDQRALDILCCIEVIQKVQHAGVFRWAFEDCGMFPINFRRTLKCGFSERKVFENHFIQEEYHKLVEDNMERFVDSFLKNGVLEDKIMDECRIPKAAEEENKRDKDDRVARSNRCIILTSTTYLDYLKNKRENQVIAANATAAAARDRNAITNDRITSLVTAVGAEKTKSQTLSRELKNAQTDSAKKDKEIGKKDKEIDKKDKEIEKLRALLKDVNATSGEHKRKKPNGKSKSTTSSSDHMEVDHDDDGKITLDCCSGKKVSSHLVLICGNCNVFHTCRQQRCSHIMPEHTKNCKK